jgi:hypothetical protein
MAIAKADGGLPHLSRREEGATGARRGIKGAGGESRNRPILRIQTA